METSPLDYRRCFATFLQQCVLRRSIHLTLATYSLTTNPITMRFHPLVGLAFIAPVVLGAQQTDSTAGATPATAPVPTAAATPASDTGFRLAAPQFSGTLFSNYMYQTGKDGRGMNSFNFDRAYLTAMEQLSGRASAHATLDVFNGSDLSEGGNTGYIARLQYGYLQYDYLQGTNWNASASFGMLPTVTISHDEQFWPRWIAKSPTELAGYFEIADLGAATLITMPNKWGEVYAAVTNGPGYTTTTDPDRYKDYQARVTLTPLSSHPGILSTFDLSGWYYKGAVENGFTTASLDRDRWGVFAGIRDPHLTVGFNWAENKDQSATSATTTADSTGRLLSGYVVLHPFVAHPFGLVLRYDQLKPNTSADPNYSVFIGGLTYDLTKRASISADYQELDMHSGAAPVSGVLAAPRAAYMHVVVNY